jgi:hypothetical protein
MFGFSLNEIYLVLSIFLALLNIYQFFAIRNEKQFIKGLVRSWQNHIEGIKNTLLQLAFIPGHQLTKEKLLGNIQALSQQAAALDKAMIEQRFYDDKELKVKRDDNDKQFKELLAPKKVNQS